MRECGGRRRAHNDRAREAKRRTSFGRARAREIVVFFFYLSSSRKRGRTIGASLYRFNTRVRDGGWVTMRRGRWSSYGAGAFGFFSRVIFGRSLLSLRLPAHVPSVPHPSLSYAIPPTIVSAVLTVKKQTSRVHPCAPVIPTA